MKKILTLVIIILSLFTNDLKSQEQYDFAVYHDYNEGAWQDGIIAFEKFLDWKGLTHKRISAYEINTTELKGKYKVIYFPGGDADYYNADINMSGIENIQELISEGGAYIGMCAGAEFASDKLIWRGIAYDYPLDLFEGVSIGPIDELAIWPGYDMVTLSMNLGNDLNKYEKLKEDMLYWGGSVFSPYTEASYDTVATFDGYLNQLAIINFEYGDGRVLLISPHPEIEEDSDRDNVDVAQELYDNGTDWNFLWTATDWLLGNTLTYPETTSIESFNQQTITIFPNPASHLLYIGNLYKYQINAITIFDITGRIRIQQKDKFKSIDVSKLNNGIYIVKIEGDNIEHIDKLIVKK